MKVKFLKDNIALVELDGDAYEYEVVEFDDSNKTRAILLTMTEDGGFYALLDQPGSNLNVGSDCHRVLKTFTIDVPRNAIGNVFNFEGKKLNIIGIDNIPIQPIYILKQEHIGLEIEPRIDKIDCRMAVSRPLKTGVFVIDTVLAIGKGQRELIVGDRQTGKTAIALDTIISQKGQNVICIYCMIGGQNQEIVNIYDRLGKLGALDYTIIVAAPASDISSRLFLIPYVATTFAEAYRNEGQDVLIIYDNLSVHAKAYRTIKLLMQESPGREAYPGDIFYIHSRLLERAGQFNEKKGGGSITALPIVQTEKENISSYISTNIISITDGQVFMSTEAFNANLRPAVNIGVSVSRVGGNAQPTFFKQEVGNLKSILAQYSKIASVSNISSLSREKYIIFKKGLITKKLFIQNDWEPNHYIFEWAMLVLINNNLLEHFDDDDIKKFKFNFRNFVKKDVASIKLMEYVETLENSKKYAKEVINFFAIQIFAPFVKWYANKIYDKNSDKINKLNYQFMSFSNISYNFEFENPDYEINILNSGLNPEERGA